MIAMAARLLSTLRGHGATRFFGPAQDSHVGLGGRMVRHPCTPWPPGAPDHYVPAPGARRRAGRNKGSIVSARVRAAPSPGGRRPRPKDKRRLAPLRGSLGSASAARVPRRWRACCGSCGTKRAGPEASLPGDYQERGSVRFPPRRLLPGGPPPSPGRPLQPARLAWGPPRGFIVMDGVPRPTKTAMYPLPCHGQPLPAKTYGPFWPSVPCFGANMEIEERASHGAGSRNWRLPSA